MEIYMLELSELAARAAVRPASVVQISARNLGALMMPSFCPRCFWIQQHAHKLPFQIPMPGIFSSIDAYTKKVVHGFIDRNGHFPQWLSDLGVVGYRNPPHYSRFFILDREFGIKLTGVPDGIFVRPDGSHVIADYKTARFTEKQDQLFPLYEVQLNAYAYIGVRAGFDPVSGLYLVYAEPVTDADTAVSSVIASGFSMPLFPKILEVDLKPEIIRALMRKVREISDLPEAPERTPGCADCAALDELLIISARELRK